ncbi:MAG TPA: type II secretion system protein N, partial [Dokdonella sp.]
MAIGTGVLLGALALGLLVRLIWRLVPHADARLDATPVRVGAAAAAAAPSIASWHLFGDTPQRGGPGAGGAAALARLILRGTLAGADPGDGYAVIADAERGERAFRAGEDVAPGVRLARVYADHVVLAHGAAEDELKLPRARDAAPAGAAAGPRAQAIGAGAPAAAAAPNAAGAPAASA